jgi:hypothetical protein
MAGEPEATRAVEVEQKKLVSSSRPTHSSPMYANSPMSAG